MHNSLPSLLNGKHILITGGSRGIGAAIAQEAAKAGAVIALTYTSRPDSAEAVLQSLAGKGHFLLKMNVADESSVHAAFEEIDSRWSDRLDGLVNNAGITRDQLSIRMKTEDFDAVIQTNLRGTFLSTRLASKVMMRQKSGSIVNITSVIGQLGQAGQANYAASKAGIEALSRSIALELASRHIRINCVAPGFIATDMTGALSDAQRKAILDKIPLGLIGEPADVAYAVCFLLSDHAKYITGHTLDVNGGISMR